MARSWLIAWPEIRLLKKVDPGMRGDLITGAIRRGVPHDAVKLVASMT